jgi:hypothetical protein
MEAQNDQVCLSGIASREALYNRFNDDIKNRLSFSKLAPNNYAVYKLLLPQVGHAYERRLQDKNKPHHNDHKPKYEKNMRQHDDDGDKGSDSKNPSTEKKGPKPVKVDKGIALKSILDSLLETRAQREECKCCGSNDHRWVFCKNPNIFLFNRRKNEKSKIEPSVPDVVTSSSKIKPRSLANQKPTAACSLQVLYEVESDSMEIDH